MYKTKIFFIWLLYFFTGFLYAEESAERHTENDATPILATIPIDVTVSSPELQAQQLEEAEQKLYQLIGENTLLLPKNVAQIYLDNEFHSVWQNTETIQLFFREYIPFILSGVSNHAEQKFIQYLNQSNPTVKDILLTDLFIDFLSYNENVSLFANQWLYQANSYKTKNIAPEKLQQLSTDIKAGNLIQFIHTLIPQNHIYHETIDQLFTMLNENKPAQPHSKLTQTLKPYEQSEEVQILAQLLLQKGLITQLPSDDIYQGELLQAVKLLQKNNKLVANGIINKSTRKLINLPESEPITLERLALNAQRLRIIPDFTNGVFVNIPSYQLYYFRNDQLILQSKVIVGRNDRRTPVMSSRLSNIVVNPPWNAPVKLINEDLVPKMHQDPSYVERKSYQILDNRGQIVDPYSIEWENYVGKKFPYRIRQKPGNDSALGRYKFNMPSSEAIYLHDTPNRELFNKKNRALSSGCIRIAKSDEFATILLTEAGWNETSKQNALRSNRTISVPIQSDNPVYLYYVTVWVEGGEIHTLPDIYGFDKVIHQSKLDWSKINNLIAF